MSEVRTIGICTGGGDAPGLNAVIRAAVKCAILKYKWRVIGIPDGFDGLIWPERSFPLELRTVSGILPRGGTILGTTNRGNPFVHKSIVNGKEVTRDLSEDVIRNAHALGIDAVIVIGGDGSQNTALYTATDAIDKIHSTGESHHRVMVIELMGRDAGWIALEAGIAGGAHVILIPEIPFTIERVADYVKEREHIGKRFTIVVIAEGVKLPPELHQFEQERRKSPRSMTVGMLIGDAIGKAAQKEVRVAVLGHIQRGGQPSPFDPILPTQFGAAAVDLIAHGGFRKMVCLHNSRIRSVDIADAIGVLKMVDADGDLVRAARSIGICFGD